MWLGVLVLLYLLFRFAFFIQANSYDLVQHFLLIDELMKHAEVRPGTQARIGAMAIYPPVAHWLATLVGWIGGSGLVGISIVAICSVFFSYLLIFRIVGADSAVSTLLLFGALLLLQNTKSLVGWEVVTNFFYPQLVADVAYLALLFWVSRRRSSALTAFAVAVVGTVTMWIQPLVAVHVLTAGCFLLTYQAARSWKADRARLLSDVSTLLILALASLALVAFHPSFRLMRQIAANNGYLEFGYSHVLRVAIACAAVGVLNLWRHWRGRGTWVDVVLSTALLGGVFLALIQFALLAIHGDGSEYAVKKHMFIVLTLATMNAIRLVSAYLPGVFVNSRPFVASLMAPLAAGTMSFFALSSFNVPAAPIVTAMSYANHVASLSARGLLPGGIVSADNSLIRLANVMISLTAFQHPFDSEAIAWQRGSSMGADAKLVMVDRAQVDGKNCNERIADGTKNVVVEPACLLQYKLGDILGFAAGGSGASYISSDGWGGAEPWGTWTVGKSAISLILPKENKGSYQMIVDGMAWLPAEHPAQDVVVEVNGTRVATWKFTQAEPSGKRTATFPSELLRDGLARITFQAPGAVSPAQLGLSADSRVLGIGIKTIWLQSTDLATGAPAPKR